MDASRWVMACGTTDGLPEYRYTSKPNNNQEPIACKSLRCLSTRSASAAV